MEKLIVVYDSQNKVIDKSLYDFVKIQYMNGNPFTVCNVTEEEFVRMEEQVSHGRLYELEPRLGKDNTYNQFRYMMSFAGNSDGINITNYADSSETGNYLLTDSSLVYEDKKAVASNIKGLKIYTTTSYREVINHYISNTKNLQNVRDEDLKKSIKDIEEKILALRETRYK